MMGCPECGAKLDFCGSRPVFDKESGEVVHNDKGQMYQLLYYCKLCNANIEYTRLLDE